MIFLGTRHFRQFLSFGLHFPRRLGKKVCLRSVRHRPAPIDPDVLFDVIKQRISDEMARYRGQKSLYEVMNRARIKSSRSSTEPLHSQESDIAGTESGSETPKQEQSVDFARYRRPKPIQINQGRIELTIPVKAAVILVLVVIVCLLLSFRLGQLYSGSDSGTDESFIENRPTNNTQDTQGGMEPAPAEEVDNKQQVESLGTSNPVDPPQVPVNADTLRAGNAIVIQQFDKLADLKAVGRYFNREGIPTEIVQKGLYYFLITQERFKVEELGSKGTQKRIEIRELGKNYKAPQGLETFSAHYFSDAYSKLIDDTFEKVKE